MPYSFIAEKKTFKGSAVKARVNVKCDKGVNGLLPLLAAYSDVNLVSQEPLLALPTILSHGELTAAQLLGSQTATRLATPAWESRVDVNVNAHTRQPVTCVCKLFMSRDVSG